MKTHYMTLSILVPDDREEYFEDAAGARGITKNELINRTVITVLRDKMFLSILDDDVQENTRSPRVLPPLRPIRRRISIYDRCDMLLQKIREKGRVCRADLGDSAEALRWQGAITKLVADNKIRADLPGPDRRVYYVLVEQPASDEVAA